MGRAIIKSLSDRSTVRAATNDPTVHAMFDDLVDHAEKRGWKTIFTKSHTASVQFHKDHPKGTYRHSFIVNTTRINFYLRVHALRIDPTATERAQKAFADVQPNVNQTGETTIKLRTVAEARRAAEMYLS